MQRKDYLLLALIIPGVFFFIWFDHSRQWYLNFNTQHSMITSFIKFGILATFGEMVGLRIRKGFYVDPSFGVFPKFIVWGVLGMTIKMAFDIFASGTPIFLKNIGMEGAIESMQAAFTLKKLMVAFATSMAMNVIYAPVMMTFHKITDLHIQSHQGHWSSLLKPIRFADHFRNINWEVQWHFVFKKTIPFFWIPAHTITFLLPVDFRVLFAALLSVMLGLILAIASLKSKN